jgi:hypothetical protein
VADAAAGGACVGHSIATSGIRQRTGVSIAALLRDGTLLSNPGPGEALEAGQSIAILGTLEQRSAFHVWVHAGGEAVQPEGARPVVPPIDLSPQAITRAASMLRATRDQDG